MLLRRRRRLLLLQLELGADRWEVARPCSVQGKFFRRKFKDRATTRGSLTRSPTLAMVGGRCLVVFIMEEGSSSSAQRATLLVREVRWWRCPVQPGGGILWGCQGQSQHRAEPKSCDRDPSEGICLARSDYGCSLGSRASSTSPSYCSGDLQAVLQHNCSGSGGATPAAVTVLYLFIYFESHDSDCSKPCPC